ncbi:hypothetical protein MNEG_11974 [Monoraphidium neglectum]|uniref:Uncharacterized protein n=1 Tax=Monoraphidium neglectum TaxID=145388 RepID=A0A0D2J898_9CHLO|nr:hypothetical protein MNEG_11974 [Monoraphidium neglectum]KIY95987.1 hypothetical protein MNEG_11974 [Monoraphidium neglectum]|eukprot:XP_013895007.1 hypothetical protein MNEG_11974 [Monoraphidium neglectum]
MARRRPILRAHRGSNAAGLSSTSSLSRGISDLQSVVTSGSSSSSSTRMSSSTSTSNRRAACISLLAGAAAVASALAPPSARAAAAAADGAAAVEEQAYAAYAERRFAEAVRLLDSIAEPDNPRWLEMRAQVLVDGKDFEGAVRDYGAALRRSEEAGAPLTDRARLLSGRALAYEGLSKWAEALADYDAAMALAAAGGESPDPYVINARGNCLNSLRQWREAREEYLAAADVFQASRGYRGRNGNTTARLDGAIFAASNAALMLAEMGDAEGAEAEMRRIARRAPGSADMRVALAALLWQRGLDADAEEQWQYACDRITVGCRKYTDADWLSRVRRWPPSMVAALSDFLSLKHS